jgi:hypothetical protein
VFALASASPPLVAISDINRIALRWLMRKRKTGTSNALHFEADTK